MLERVGPDGRKFFLRGNVRYQWSIGIRRGPSPLHLTSPRPGAAPVLTYRDVTDASAAFVADPFMIWVAAQWHMFFEVFDTNLGRGQIAHATSRDGLAWRYDRVVLREDFHLSYPHVFRSGGELFMVPETLALGAVTLYIADSFPDRWRRLTTLVHHACADPTLFRHHGRWWLMGCPNWRSNDALRLFHAPRLRGPWLEHGRSPIRSGDPRLSRPAGRVVAFDGRLIRFAQDCAHRYGSGVNVLEILTLDTQSYAERELAVPLRDSVDAEWCRAGMHHIDAHPSRDGAWIACVDGCRDLVRVKRAAAGG
jgi:hypothetical protein